MDGFAPSVTNRGDKGLYFSWLWFYTTFEDFAKIGFFLDQITSARPFYSQCPYSSE